MAQTNTHFRFRTQFQTLFPLEIRIFSFILFLLFPVYYIELRNQYNIESQITYMLLSMHHISVYIFDRVKFTILFTISFLIVLLLRIHYNFQSE